VLGPTVAEETYNAPAVFGVVTAAYGARALLLNPAMAEQIPPHALSRASAYEWMGSLILLPVGYLAAGPIAGATSTETVLVVGAALTAAVLAVGILPRETRMLQRVEHGSPV
jgi:hypothetical protein